MTDTADAVAVFGSSFAEPGGPDWTAAEECGRRFAEAGLTVINGGYGGVMEAASQGAAAAGGRVVGITAPTVFPDRRGANPWLTDEQPAATLTARIDALFTGAAAVVALPGGIGTFTELMVAWNRAFVAAAAGRSPDPVVAVGDRWAELIVGLSWLLPADASLITCVGTAEEAVAAVLAGVRRSAPEG